MNDKRIVAIIQARMGSSRLPGKIMKDFCGKPSLYRMLERVKQSKYIDEIVIATSVEPWDDPLVEICKSWGVSTFRGSNEDVLSRYWGAAQMYPAGIYVRLTSDCPVIDAVVIDEIIEYYLNHDYRYVSGSEKLPNGIGAEVFTAELLQEAAEKATEGYEHEHVTPYMYWKQDSVGKCPLNRDLSLYRITLDTAEDYEVLAHIYNALYTPENNFTMDQIISYLDQNPEIFAINSEIHQKGVKEGYE